MSYKYSDINQKIYIELQEFETLFYSQNRIINRRKRKTLGDWRALALTQSSDYSTIRDIVLEFGSKLEKMAKIVSELKKCEEGQIFECMSEFKNESATITENLLSDKHLDNTQSLNSKLDLVY
jgi:hypothetical protein